MKAMIFAAGLGTRLRPLTNDRPKALVEVGGVPMIERVIKRLGDAGFDDITVNVHHFGQKIIDFLNDNGNFGLNIHVSDERDLLLDTGGGILKARPYLDGNEPFLVHNADILTDLDLKSFYEYHKNSGALASVLVKSRVTARYFLFDEQDHLHGWVNKKTGETKPAGFAYKQGQYRELAFGGVHVMSPEIFDVLEKYTTDKVFSITPFYTGECDKYQINGYEQEKPYKWFDVGKPETLAQANAEFK